MPGFMYLPKRQTMWDQLFPMMLQMAFKKKMFDEQLQAQKDIAKQATTAQIEKEKRQRGYKAEERYQTLQEQGWQTPEQAQFGQEYTPTPDTVRAGKGLYRPQVIPKVFPIKETGGAVLQIGNKMQYIKPDKNWSQPITITPDNQAQYGKLPVGSVIQAKGTNIKKIYVPKVRENKVYVSKIQPDGSIVKVQVPKSALPVWENKGFTRGQITKPVKTKGPPAAYFKSLRNAFDDIDKGADPTIIYKRMRKKFPGQAKSLKSILIDSDNLPGEVKLDLVDAVNRIKQGADPNGTFRALAAKYPKHSAIIRRILLTPVTLSNTDFSELFRGR